MGFRHRRESLDRLELTPMPAVGLILLRSKEFEDRVARDEDGS